MDRRRTALAPAASVAKGRPLGCVVPGTPVFKLSDVKKKIAAEAAAAAAAAATVAGAE